MTGDLEQRFTNSINLLDVDSKKFNTIVNGATDSTTTIDSGVVPSLSNRINQVYTNSIASLSNLQTKKFITTGNLDSAATSTGEAMVARDNASTSASNITETLQASTILNNDTIASNTSASTSASNAALYESESAMSAQDTTYIKEDVDPESFMLKQDSSFTGTMTGDNFTCTNDNVSVGQSYFLQRRITAFRNGEVSSLVFNTSSLVGFSDSSTGNQVIISKRGYYYVRTYIGIMYSVIRTLSLVTGAKKNNVTFGISTDGRYVSVGIAYFEEGDALSVELAVNIPQSNNMYIAITCYRL